MIKFAISKAIAVRDWMRKFSLVVKGHNVELAVLIGVDCGSGAVVHFGVIESPITRLESTSSDG